MNKIFHGDSLEVLKELENDSVDLVACDPPYGYSFMGKAWDKALPDIGIFKECLRVLKPGGFAFVMSAPRSDVCSRMAILLEDAGFNIAFTPIYWTYASGFPKAGNIGKLVDKRLGVERTVTGTMTTHKITKAPGGSSGAFIADDAHGSVELDTTAATSPEAKALDGSYAGFQPKPAVEVIIVAMKPLSEKTYIDQALKNGKGITWLDDCRVPFEPGGEWSPQIADDIRGGNFKNEENKRNPDVIQTPDSRGRFPANLLISDDVLADHSRFFSVDEWAQTLPFLAVPKASKGEKNRGLDGMPTQQKAYDYGSIKKTEGRHGENTARANHHPTVKPLKLMSYLITLGSRPGDVVLDPFCGSGTTCIAAKELGRDFIGIEREQEYVEIAEARLQAVNPTLSV